MAVYSSLKDDTYMKFNMAIIVDTGRCGCMHMPRTYISEQDVRRTTIIQMYCTQLFLTWMTVLMIWMTVRKCPWYLAKQIYENFVPNLAIKFYITHETYCYYFYDTIIQVVHSIPS